MITTFQKEEQKDLSQHRKCNVNEIKNRTSGTMLYQKNQILHAQMHPSQAVLGLQGVDHPVAIIITSPGLIARDNCLISLGEHPGLESA